MLLFKNHKKLMTVLLVLVGLVGAWYVAYPWGSFRYKITVAIETPEGVKTGSAVREVGMGSEPALLGTSGGGGATVNKGEAVVIDLGARGVVFATTGSGDYGVVFAAFPYEHDGLSPEGIRHYTWMGPAKAVLQPEHYPQFVMFKDMKDPKSVTLVRGGVFNAEKQEYDAVDHFEKLFGAGVKLKSVEIEITDEKVTRGMVEKYLFLGGYNISGFQEWYNNLPYGDARRVHSYHLIKGE